MDHYYADKLNFKSLFRVYETDLPRIQQYLHADIEFVKGQLSPTDRVLEVGAGYGRIVRELSPFCNFIVGMDISDENIQFGKEYCKNCSNVTMLTMNAHQMTFDCTFDKILCLQNGLSAMKANSAVVCHMIQLLAPGGKAYFSTYSNKFWDWRLKWFEEQALKGLLGEIDYEKTKDGVIICKDGFRAMTHSPEDLQKIGDAFLYPYEIREVDESSVFLIIEKPKNQSCHPHDHKFTSYN